jgi:hypothetical protein
MMDINYKGILWFFAIALMLIAVMAAMVASSGCVTAAKNIYKDAVKTPTPTPTPLPTPTPTPKPTPLPTPASIPTLAAHYVNPFTPGERWENQWYQWRRLDVQGINGEGKKDLWVGIVAYRHAFLDRYSWYNNADGNYYSQIPSDGNRYFVVWVHEEMLGNDSSWDPSFWAFDETAFRVQVGNQMIAPDESHNPVNHILEFDNFHDYYDAVIAPPFSWNIRYTGHDPATGGYAATRQGWLRWGKGNAIDGYIIFEVPKGTYEKDVILLGAFSTFGNAYWRFST